MVEVQPDGNEPYDVKGYYPPVAEGCKEKIVRILRFPAHEFLQLHLCPEVGEVEGNETKDDDSEDCHVLGAPAVVLCLGGNLITLEAAALHHVLIAEPDAVEDMDGKTQGQDGNHDGDDGGGHEVAAKLEPAVSVGIGEGV